MTKNGNIEIINSNNDKYIYKASDFIKMGIKSGSLWKLIKDLGLNTPEYCVAKFNSENHNRKTLYYTQEAFEKVLEYQRNKEKVDNRNEIPLIQRVNDLTKQIILIKAQNEEEKGRLKDTIIQQMKELQNEKDKNEELKATISMYDFKKAKEITDAIKEVENKKEEEIKPIKEENEKLLNKNKELEEQNKIIQTDLRNFTDRNKELQEENERIQEEKRKAIEENNKACSDYCNKKDNELIEFKQRKFWGRLKYALFKK